MTMETAAPTLADEAIRYLRGGLSLVPCSAKDKRPDSRLLPRDENGDPTWAPYQQAPPDEATVRQWFARGCKSVAAVGGAVSGGLLMLDFDVEGFFERWRDAVAELADGLPVEHTGGGTYQLWLRCPDPGRNDKLAYAADENAETGRVIAIETRAEGGYAILPGSLHPEGTYYVTVAGDFAEVPMVSQARADALIAAGRKLDEAPLTRQEMERARKSAKESTRRSEVNGQASVIDAYNQAVTIEAALEAYGYKRASDTRWTCAIGSGSPSVFVEDGRSFHHSTNDPLCDGYWHRAFSLYCYYEHGGDCREAVKAAAEQLGMKGEPHREYDPAEAPADQDEPPAEIPPASDRRDEKVRFEGITCADLMAAEFDVRFLVDRILVDGQPCMVAGPSKSLKTSLLLDMALSLSQAGYFLGKFPVTQAVTVGMMTGESGLPTVQETIRRIARAANVDPTAIRNLVISERVPKFGHLLHEDAFRAFVQEFAIEVVIVDPAYMCLDGENQANLAAQGEQLRRMNEICREHGVSLVLCHHTKKETARRYEPLELVDLTGAGHGEWARQWILLSRREPYESGTGCHRMWCNVGGSTGHGGLWGLNIDEGNYTDEGGRFWSVGVLDADEARQEASTQRGKDKQDAKARKLEEDLQKAVEAFIEFPNGETKNVLKSRAGLSGTRFDATLAELLKRRQVVPCQVSKSNWKAPVEGFKLAESQYEE